MLFFLDSQATKSGRVGLIAAGLGGNCCIYSVNKTKNSKESENATEGKL